MNSTSGNSDRYVYPGTTVLQNLRGLTDQDSLNRFEARHTHRRIAELIEKPIQGTFDAVRLKSIHAHIFQDVYAWAGQFRTVNLSKGGHLFGLAVFLEPAVRQRLTKLGSESCLVGAGAGRFVKRAAFFLSELNAAHPFREGNGRTQREFIRQLGLSAAPLARG